MTRALEDDVRTRAGHRCEYCRMPEGASTLPHVIDHIIAQQHHGPTVSENLALCCGQCNRRKGPNLSGIDPATGRITTLFHPRTQNWPEHFEWHGARLVGLTDTGRATIDVLAINMPSRIAAREALLDEGNF